MGKKGFFFFFFFFFFFSPLRGGGGPPPPPPRCFCAPFWFPPPPPPPRFFFFFFVSVFFLVFPLSFLPGWPAPPPPPGPPHSGLPPELGGLRGANAPVEVAIEMCISGSRNQWWERTSLSPMLGYAAQEIPWRRSLTIKKVAGAVASKAG